MISARLREYHKGVYRSLRADKEQPREAKSEVADMCKEAAERIDGLTTALRRIVSLGELNVSKYAQQIAKEAIDE